ncbi:MAG: MFS transporter [Bacteroidetes bacterium]|jgi:proton-dependent oligopeptide transporter, POT family|nr:MFS transporter [Bacteroidota bacterium]MBT3748500.1 MFS transporter [Bacteroidota bacterium]MBT4402237.1 MFS transporter [Bacteroidota bacterium]MBT5425328.1 MFS transporter [Bacteroidota bacterium]MBT7462482.1 MFS transporter [Bacteroidota bacterium]
MENSKQPRNDRFPRSFWTANLTELFERSAYYAMASFVVLYLGQLGLGDYWPSNLNGILWALVFFLPILSGSIADQIGYKKSLLIAFGFLAAGYFIMGYPVWFGGHVLNQDIGHGMTAGIGVLLPIVSAIIIIGIGGSIIKPCIAGTVQKTAGSRATLGFGIFYMIINIGSLLGRGVSYVIRKEFDLSYIFAVSVFFSIIAFLAVLLFYSEPVELGQSEEDKKPKKSIWKILADMVLVLRNLRFTLFMIVSSGFFIVYSQVYNVLPLYLQRVVELDPAVDLVTMANPFVIVFFQLLITKKFGKMKPIKSIIVGIVIIGISMMINLIPIFMDGGVRSLTIGDAIPLGTLFITLTVGLIAFGELFTSARTYEYVGALAPKGQEGLFLGYANLPLAIGAIIGGPAGAFIFHEVMCKNAIELESGLLELNPFWNSMGWIILMGIGFVSAFSMWLYNRWLQKRPQ